MERCLRLFKYPIIASKFHPLVLALLLGFSNNIFVGHPVLSICVYVVRCSFLLLLGARPHLTVLCSWIVFCTYKLGWTQRNPKVATSVFFPKAYTRDRSQLPFPLFSLDCHPNSSWPFFGGGVFTFQGVRASNPLLLLLWEKRQVGVLFLLPLKTVFPVLHRERQSSRN